MISTCSSSWPLVSSTVVACRKLCRTSNVWKREWYLSWRNSVDLLQTFEKNTKLSLKLVNKNFYYLWNLSWNDPGLNTCWKGRAWPPPSSPTSAPRHRQPPPQLRACWPCGFRVSLMHREIVKKTPLKNCFFLAMLGHPYNQMFSMYIFSHPWMKYCSLFFFWHLCSMFGKHFRNHFKRIHVQGELKELLVVWHQVNKKPVSGKRLTEGVQEVKRTSILVRLQSLAVWLLSWKGRVL